ncbi:YrbL family protein, partial [Salmonella enterica]|nr:YrbL family protein [Salmonella enterica]
MILLSEQTPLGAGRHRKCYTHPDNARRCIKVIYNRDHGGDKEIRRELSYYAHLSRYLTDWSAIPRYYGTVETDCGTGYVYDMITDFNGAPSITLTEFAAQCR